MRSFINILIFTTISIGILFMSFSCSDEADSEPFIELSENTIDFERFVEIKTITVNTNVKNITCQVNTNDWCTVDYSAGKLTVSTTSVNTDKNPRTIMLLIGGDNVSRTIPIKQLGRNLDYSGLKDDLKIKVKSGTASSSQSGEGIEKSFDGDMATLYHSRWDRSIPFPIVLTYDFENVPTMDYLIYYPRTSGTNGNFKKFKLYVATESNNTLTEYGTYDFEGSTSPNRISFVPSLEKPIKIQFVVESGMGGGTETSFASCAEMEFYTKNSNNFNYLTIFTDITCSQLKSTISEQDINSIPDAFFKELALEIYKEAYDTEFRVQHYEAYKNPVSLANQNKTGTLGMRDNPTGIYVDASEEIILFVENVTGQYPSLFIQDVDNEISGSTYLLSTGLNKIKSATKGLIYIMYYTPSGTEPAVKINIATGHVNGYFDSQKHKKEDWQRILNKATFKHFDVIGKYASLTFETQAFKTYTPDGLALIDKYDDLVRLEQEFIGLYKYGKEFKNRPYFLVVYGDNYMYSAGEYTGYNNSTQKNILDLSKLSTTACWGPAHELGHSLQTRPGFKWIGMTEVTNNLLSMYIQTSWKNRSRLLETNYQNAHNSLLKKNVPHNKPGIDVFEKLVPLWQLKLYMHDVLGQNDFYKDVYEAVRNQTNIDVSVLTESYYQLEFVKIACDIAKLDLTEFFEAWGFLTEIDAEINDYAKAWFTITSQQIQATKKYIADKNYSMPKHSNIYDITDDNIAQFK